MWGFMGWTRRRRNEKFCLCEGRTVGDPAFLNHLKYMFRSILSKVASGHLFGFTVNGTNIIKWWLLIFHFYELVSSLLQFAFIMWVTLQLLSFVKVTS